MRKIIKFLFNRMTIVALLILIQLAFVILVVVKLSESLVYIYWGFQIASLSVILWLITKPDNPSYKLAWTIPILLFPLFGGLFYLIFGNKSLSKKLHTRITDYAQDQSQHFAEDKLISRELAVYDPHLFRQAEYVTRISGFPVCRNTQAVYFPLGEAKWASLLEELRKAKKFILMEYFIIEPGQMWDSVFAILTAKAAEGVEIKLMYDDLGSIQTIPSGYDKVIRKAGIEVTVFNPFRPRLSSVMNYRDHRKITVIDGNVGFTGGINLADEYINAYPKHGHWKDTAVLLRGDAVRSLTLMFLHLWEFCNSGVQLDPAHYMPTEPCEGDGYIQPFGDIPLDAFNVAENAYMQMINCAQNYIYITTPYLILDNEMTTALCIAAQSGVDVRIITPHVADKWFVHMVTQSNYQQLIEAGVHIYEYTPGFIHAKMLVCDDEIAIVGTTNMDYRSFYLHFECGVLFYFSSIVAAVKKDILETITVSEEMTLETSRGIKRRHRLLRSVLRAFAPLM